MATSPCVVEEHARCGGKGRFFAEVEEGGAAVGQAEGHEAAAAEIAGGGVDDGEGVADGDGGVDGVAALGEHVEAGFGGERLGGDHHGVAAGDGGLVVCKGGRGDQ